MSVIVGLLRFGDENLGEATLWYMLFYALAILKCLHVSSLCQCELGGLCYREAGAEGG
jgi:hypothetical protein